MTHTYTISGMTCGGCQAKVQGLLSAVKGVREVRVDLEKGEAVVEMDRHIATEQLRVALKDYPKYRLEEVHGSPGGGHREMRMEPVGRKEEIGRTMPEAAGTEGPEDMTSEMSWGVTYRPILLIFGYILGGTLLVEATAGAFVWMRWMGHFMAAFFLVFSFFKLLDIRGFAESYRMYDVVASRWPAWGVLYPFVELLLGVAYLAGAWPVVVSAVTFVVMGVSLVGVLQSVLNKRRIRCACLGAVFNLPMSTVTIVEDGLMIIMSAVMLTYTFL